MRTKEFNQLKKKETPTKLLHKHINSMIFLTTKQINTLIELKKEVK